MPRINPPVSYPPAATGVSRTPEDNGWGESGASASPTFKDLFDGANSTLLTAHAPDIDDAGTGWVDPFGSAGSLRLDGSGSAVGTGIIGEKNMADTGIDSSNCIVKCNFDLSGSSGVLIFGKFGYGDRTDASWDGVVAQLSDSSGAAVIQSYAAGSGTQRDTYSIGTAGLSDETYYIQYTEAAATGVRVFNDPEATHILEYTSPTATMSLADAIYIQTRRTGDKYRSIEHFNTSNLSELP